MTPKHASELATTCPPLLCNEGVRYLTKCPLLSKLIDLAGVSSVLGGPSKYGGSKKRRRFVRLPGSFVNEAVDSVSSYALALGMIEIRGRSGRRVQMVR